MRSTIAAVSAAALLALVPTAVAALQVDRFEDFDIAVDAAGDVLVGSFDGEEVVISRLDDSIRREWYRVGAPGGRQLRLVLVGAAVDAVWLERDLSGSQLVLAVFTDEKTVVFRPRGLKGDFDQLDAAPLADGSIGVVLTENSEPNSRVHWVELDLSSGEASKLLTATAVGRASFPSVLVCRRTWIAWQERTGTGLRLAATLPLARSLDEVYRFEVRGFGGIAAPALTASPEGTAVLTWQGTAGKWESVLRSRKLTVDGFGPVRTVAPPRGISGMLMPATAAGRVGVVTAYGWGGGGEGRWYGLRVDVSAGKVSTVSSGIAGESMRLPRLAVGSGGQEYWVWPSERAGVRGVELSAARDSELSHEEPQPVLPTEPEPDTIYALAFGDSITEGKESTPDKSQQWPTPGYTSYLRKEYSKRIRTIKVIKRGRGAEKTPEGLARLPVLLEKYPYIRFALILEGTNDAFRGYLPEDVAANLGAMADMVRDAGAIPVLGTLLPRFDAARPQAEAISAAIKMTARLRGVSLCDFQALFPKNTFFFSDLRLHPNQKGYEKMAEFWLETLVTYEGDVDRSFTVDGRDLLLLTAAMQTHRGSWAFNPDADLNDDGHVDVRDLTELLAAVGKSF